ncbi:MAG: Co2+/Mg2+ efflux protein ApaG [Bacteroidetes bacterium]|nr:Co2+/Mg2+ efflux protein ApaG [Bacteroidota bacterium]
MKLYTATTDNITVSVQPVFLDGQSNPLARRFVFAYFVRIENRGDQEVQLLHRHWLITDGHGDVKEVQGEGVVGLQPRIAPGAIHEYNSFAILETFEGSMEGSYRMVRPSGEEFDIAIPRFTLRAAAN